MRILLVNPPYLSITSVHGAGHQIPLGLLCVGGPLTDAGHEVSLLDAEALRLNQGQIAEHIRNCRPDIVMTGHAGSTPAHEVAVATLATAKSVDPAIRTVYGGPYPTYHGEDILAAEPAVDFIVSGEGEAIARELVRTLAEGGNPADVRGLVLRLAGEPFRTPDAPAIRALDDWRVGWELIDDWDRYQCFGLGRAAIVQFSRGCPHQCNYCGQYQFWERWRHRSPKLVVDEIEALHREHGIAFITLADENPTSSKKMWRAFLEELASRHLPIRLFATLRAADVVRDAEMLYLYRGAGLMCILMGVETTDPETLAAIRKGSTTATDREAVRLLRQHGILSMLGHIVGFEDERFGHYWRALRQLFAYDPDLLNAMYVTPHRWSDWVVENAERRVIQTDRGKWDYRHQLLDTPHLKPWQVFALVKLMEVLVHCRPRALWRILRHEDDMTRRAMRWSFRRSARVWFAEVWEFMFATQFARVPDSLRAWFRPAWKAAGAGRDEPIRIQPRVKVKVPQAPVSKPMALGFEVEQVSRNKAGEVRPTV